jgi:hypothetical protein
MTKRYSVTVTLTPRQAIDAAAALQDSALKYENYDRLLAVSSRIAWALVEAGWTPGEERWEPPAAKDGGNTKSLRADAA